MAILRRHLSPRPGAIGARLLLMPETPPDDVPLRLLWLMPDGSDGPRPRAQGHWSPGQPIPPEWQPAIDQHGVDLLLPPAAVTRYELPAPRKLKRDEWPLLVDQHGGEAGENTLELARLDYHHGRLVLLGTARSLLHGWRARLAEAGLRVDHWGSVFQGQPIPSSGTLCALPAGPDWMLCWQDDGHDGSPGRRHWLTWPRDQALPPALAAREWHQPLADEDGLARLALLARHLPARLPTLETARGEARPRQRLSACWKGLPSGLPWRRLVLVLLLVSLHLGLLAWQEQRLARQDSHQQQAARFIEPPDGKTAASQRLARRAAALGALRTRNASIERILADLTGLPDTAHLQRLEVRGQSLRLSWATPGITADDAELLHSRLASLGQVEESPSGLDLAIDLAAPLPMEPTREDAP